MVAVGRGTVLLRIPIFHILTERVVWTQPVYLASLIRRSVRCGTESKIFPIHVSHFWRKVGIVIVSRDDGRDDLSGHLIEKPLAMSLKNAMYEDLRTKVKSEDEMLQRIPSRYDRKSKPGLTSITRRDYVSPRPFNYYF